MSNWWIRLIFLEILPNGGDFGRHGSISIWKLKFIRTKWKKVLGRSWMRKEPTCYLRTWSNGFNIVPCPDKMFERESIDNNSYSYILVAFHDSWIKETKWGWGRKESLKNRIYNAIRIIRASLAAPGPLAYCLQHCNDQCTPNTKMAVMVWAL